MTTIPARGVELHDAKVLDVAGSDHAVRVLIHAFVHDDRESDSCVGCWQDIELAFTDAEFERRGAGEAITLDGSLHVDGNFTENLLPVPLHQIGAIVLTLAGADFELTVRARSLHVRRGGCARRTRGLYS